MTPLPKRKHSKGRRNRRRAHDSLQPQQLAVCANCGELHRSHHVCEHCGRYAGRSVIEVER
ncbi:MAG: 50S ribosomal protein L32 [Anaerolineales bacterium]|nr:50S ribosomal protein L32 [Anaerolineales bacterium]